MAALDNWRCGVQRVDSAEELVAAWDPDDPDQLFWVDDAFGSIRHDPDRQRPPELGPPLRRRTAGLG